MKKTLLLTLLGFGITATAQVKVGTNPTVLATNANFQVEGTTTADQFVVLKNGNVGIGTATPTEKLDVAGAIKLKSGATTDKIYSNNTNGLILESQGNLHGTVRMTLQNIDGSNGLLFEVPNASSPALIDFGFKTTIGQRNIRYETRGGFLGALPEFQFGVAGIPNFVITDDKAAFRFGNVGIGTTTPAAKLDVNGQVKISGGAPGAGKVLTSDADGLASWATPAAGGVSSVSGTAPIAVAGTTTPVISIATANTTTTGALTSADWNTFNGKQNTISATAPITLTGSAVGIATANTTTTGALTSADWNTFNGKQAALTSGTNIKTINSTSILGSGNIAVEPTVTAGTTAQYYRGDKTWQTLDKTAVGLANVDNTTDLNKPISTATQTALNAKLATASNGLTATGTLVELGGTLTKNTDIAGNFNLTTSGTGNVGIGTTAPVAKLDLVGSFKAVNNSFVVETGSNGINGILTLNNNSSEPLRLRASQNNNVEWDIDMGEDMNFKGFTTFPTASSILYLKGTGNVGIGTTSPATTLDVNGTIKISGGAPGAGKVLTSDATGLASWTTPAAGGVSSVSGTAPIAVAGTTTPVISLNDAGVTTVKLADNAVNSAKIVDDTVANADLAAGTGGIYKGSGDLAGGNVTVGNVNTLNFTTTTLSSFHKFNTTNNGGRTITGFASGNTGTDEKIFEIRTHGKDYNETMMSNSLTSTALLASINARLILGTRSNDDFIFGTNNTERMRLLSNGNVGIGTTTPAAKLDVNGQVKISGGAPGAGKVLTSDAAGLASWTTPAAGGVTSVSGTAPIAVATGTSTPVISIATANTTTTGALSSTDWNTFNGKQAALTSGTNIKTINSTSVLGSGNIAVEPTVTAGTTAQYYRGDKTWQTLDKTAVGLANVDNTTDLNKPISTATQTALNAKLATASNGLTATGTLVELGGTLTKATTIANAGFNLGITGTGNVGIGTAAPVRNLDVFADNAKMGIIANSESQTASLFFGTNAPTGVPGGGGVSSVIKTAIIAEGAGGFNRNNLHFALSSSADNALSTVATVADAKMTILNSGNVGIGTTTPAAKLDVNGQVKISGGAPGAGKVLTSDAAGLASWQTVSVATVNVDNVTAPVAATVQQAVTSGSIQFTTTNTGVIMKSADGTNYMLTIENGGVLTVKKVTP